MTLVDKMPLRGIRVVDITMAIAGPWATRMLCDAGAEVIKIEPPPTGDFVRNMPTILPGGTSAYFAQANSGKQSVCVDLKTEAGQDILRRLVATADVVVENLRPLAARRCGVTWEALGANFRRDLIFCAISGYGLSGPLVEKPGQDVALQCRTGVAMLTGKPGGPPAFPTWSLSDTLSGAIAYNAILSALWARRKDGLGRFVDVRMERCVMQLHDAGHVLLREGLPVEFATRFGSSHPSLVFRGVVECSYYLFVTISAFRRNDWKSLAAILGGEFTSEELTSSRQRVLRRVDIECAVKSLASKMTATVLTEHLRQHGVAAEIVRDIASTVKQPSTSEPDSLVDIVIDSVHGWVGGAPLNPEFAAQNLRAGPPALGADTIRVMQALGYDNEVIQQLFFDQIVSFPTDNLEKLISMESRKVG